MRWRLDQAPVRSSRGGAFCDYDNDGDLDLLVLAIDDSPTLLRNDGGNRQNWLQFRLAGRRGNRSAIGTRIKVVTGSKTRTGRVTERRRVPLPERPSSAFRPG